MSTASENAISLGAEYGRKFFYEHKFAYPTADVADERDGVPRRTAGQWDCGAYSDTVRARMRAALNTALDASLDPTSPSYQAAWPDAGMKAAWREAASAEFGRQLQEAARFPTAS